MKWVTWEQVGVDRMACAWLITKYLDPEAEFLFVPAGQKPLPDGAEPFDIPGVLAAQDDALIFAAARGAGKLLVIDAMSATVIRTVDVGSCPNGLAWDTLRKQLLVADVQDNIARLIDPQAAPGNRGSFPSWEAALDGLLPVWRAFSGQYARTGCGGSGLGLNLRADWAVSRLGQRAARVGPGPAGLPGLRRLRRGKRRGARCRNWQRTGPAVDGSPPDTSWYNARLGRRSVAIKDPGVIDVVNTQTMTVDEQIATEKGAHTTASDARFQRLYVFLPSCRAAVYEERALE